MRLLMILLYSCGPVIDIGPMLINAAGCCSEESLKNIAFDIMARNNVAMQAPRRWALENNDFLARYATENHMWSSKIRCDIFFFISLVVSPVRYELDTTRVRCVRPSSLSIANHLSHMNKYLRLNITTLRLNITTLVNGIIIANQLKWSIKSQIYLLHFYCAVSNMYKILFDGAKAHCPCSLWCQQGHLAKNYFFDRRNIFA